MFSCVYLLLVFSDSVCSVQWVDVSQRISQRLSVSMNPRDRRSLHRLSPRDLVGLEQFEELEQVDKEVTSEGTIIVKYREKFNGIPVYDAYASIETDKTTNEYTGQADGKLLHEIPDDITENKIISESQAFNIAVENATVFHKEAEVDSENIRIFIYTLDKRAILVYDVSFRLKINNHVSLPGFFISAETGQIIKQIPKLKSYNLKSVGGNIKTGQHKYGVDMPFLHVQQNGNQCSLQNEDVRVFHLHNNLDKPDLPFTFRCSDGFKDEVNDAYSPLSDLLKSVTGIPFVLYPYAVIDVIGHEIGHAFTDEHTNLEYSGQSGAICESISDIIGEAAEWYITKTTDNKAGDGIVANEQQLVVRDLCDQDKDGRSIVHVKDFTEDLNVHYSSGIFNRVACVLRDNLEWKDIFILFTYASRFFWHETSDFNNAGCGLLKAAYDLSYQLIHIVHALSNVGIEICSVEDHIRMVSEYMEIKDLKVNSANNVLLFRLDFKKLHKLSGSDVKRIQVTTSRGEGDVDMYVSFYQTISKEDYVYRSIRKGNTEVLFIDRKTMQSAFLHLVPKHSSFSGVTLTTTAR
ncbi:hap [Mytilus edulis]|uniref:Hap n=1 Tax=Mytilus edulis TaxID=6550 RepID=A0A8S3QJS6_MYTED|nr:hap [Mytilus edulis]